MSHQAPMADPPSYYRQAPANDAGAPTGDVRDCLRAEHDAVLASIDALAAETDQDRCIAGLRALRTAWIVHALAEEAVVYRAIEGVSNDSPRADERFIEHEVVGGLFDRLAQARPGSLEWKARLNVARDLISRHIDSEYRDLYPQLTQRFDAKARIEMGERFRLAREKLLVLEEAKAA